MKFKEFASQVNEWGVHATQRLLRQNIKVRRSNLMTQLEVVLKSFMCM